MAEAVLIVLILGMPALSCIHLSVMVEQGEKWQHRASLQSHAIKLPFLLYVGCQNSCRHAGAFVNPGARLRINYYNAGYPPDHIEESL